MTATLSLIVAALSLCVGFLLAKVETQRDEMRAAIVAAEAAGWRMVKS